MNYPLFFGGLLIAAMSAETLHGQVPANEQELTQRLKRLEAETDALRGEVEWLREHPVRLPTVSPASNMTELAPAAPAADGGDYFTWPELKGEMKKLVWTKGDMKIVPYGFLWGNMVYQTERTYPGTHTLYVYSASTHGEDNFVADGRNTRIGLDISGPRIPLLNCATSGGKVEIDFQGSFASTENKGGVLLRHAYCEVKDEEFRLLFGQTWDVVSPLFPGMLMYSVGWGGGNIGYRRGQLRAERYLAFSDETLVTLQGSLNQNIFSDTTVPPYGNLRGEFTSWPLVEGRMGFTLGERKGPDALPWTFGTSAHIGEQGFDYIGAPAIDDVRRKTWSLNADVRIPITQRLGFQGEFFTGENLGTFLGGILQGVNPVTLEGIRSTGGWFEVWYDWTDDLHSHVGYSIDDPLDEDIAAGGRRYNHFVFANVGYDLTEKFLVGMEVSWWKTLYNGLEPGDSAVFEFVAKYGF